MTHPSLIELNRKLIRNNARNSNNLSGPLASDFAEHPDRSSSHAQERKLTPLLGVA